MGWAKVDDRLHSHWKTAEAGVEAMGLWVLALSWTRENRTNGFVPRAKALQLGGRHARKHIAALLKASLWLEVEAGYEFHDFLDWQPRSEDEESRREDVSEKRREAGKRGAAKRWGRGNGEANSMANGMTNDLFAKTEDGNGDGKSLASGCQPDSPSPSPSPSPREKDSLPSRQDQARGVLDRLNEARLRVFPRSKGYSPTADNLKPILDRLKAGNTVEDCLHVIAVGEENARREPNGPGGTYFTAVNLFSPKSFGFKLSQQAPNGPRLSIVASPTEEKPTAQKTATQRALEREKREEAEALARFEAEKGEAS